MNSPETTPLRLEFKVYLADGYVHQFTQADTEANAKLLEIFDPHKLFAHPWIGFDSARGVTILPAAKISHMIVEIDPLPAWEMKVHSGTRVNEITREEFDELLSPENEANLLRLRERKTGESFEGVAVITVAGGDEILVRIQTAVVNIHDQRMLVDSLLGRGVLFFPCSGGFHFINVANIIQIHVMPGQPHLAPNAWRVEPLE